MSITKVWSVFCDGCGDWVAQTIDGARLARSIARANGWKRIDGQDLCSRCVSERAKEDGRDG